MVVLFFDLIAGTRLPNSGDTDAKKDVVPEHEDQVDCFGNCDCFDSYHSPLSLPWVQMWEVIINNRGRKDLNYDII